MREVPVRPLPVRLAPSGHALEGRLHDTPAKGYGATLPDETIRELGEPALDALRIKHARTQEEPRDPPNDWRAQPTGDAAMRVSA